MFTQNLLMHIFIRITSISSFSFIVKNIAKVSLLESEEFLRNIMILCKRQINFNSFLKQGYSESDFANFGRSRKIKYTQNFLLNCIRENKYTPNMHKIHISRK